MFLNTLLIIAYFIINLKKGLVGIINEYKYNKLILIIIIIGLIYNILSVYLEKN